MKKIISDKNIKNKISLKKNKCREYILTKEENEKGDHQKWLYESVLFLRKLKLEIWKSNLTLIQQKKWIIFYVPGLLSGARDIEVLSHYPS